MCSTTEWNIKDSCCNHCVFHLQLECYSCYDITDASHAGSDDPCEYYGQEIREDIIFENTGYVLQLCACRLLHPPLKMTLYSYPNACITGVLNKASDVFSNIRTVTSFHAWKQSYDEIVSAINACQMSEVYLIIAASGQGVVMAANLGTVTLGLWYSALAINEGRNSQFEVLSVISTLSLLVEGLLYVIIALPSLRVVSSAVRQIMTLVDAEPYVRDRFTLEDQNGVCEDELKGSLEFANVDFAYPVQPGMHTRCPISFMYECFRVIELCILQNVKF